MVKNALLIQNENNEISSIREAKCFPLITSIFFNTEHHSLLEMERKKVMPW